MILPLLGVIICIAVCRESPAQEAPGSIAQVRLWASDVTSDDFAPGDTSTLRPISIVAARNGTFSGKVMVESAESIRGLRASMGSLSGQGAVLPVASVRVRYSVAWEYRFPFLRELNRHQRRGWPSGQDILLEDPPAEVERTRFQAARVAVWVTVDVPQETAAGMYAGELTVQADGLAATKVPVKLDVADWTLPDSQDFHTWMDVYQSPDTLALEYNVPRWSDPHWALIARSLRFIRGTGSRVVYVPLVCGTNFGNEESMVRWVPQGEGRYGYDFTVMDRYLDEVEKNLGQPKLVILLVWDIYLSPRPVYSSHNPASGEARASLQGKGPRVTVLDPGTGTTDMVYLPRYEEPGSKELWQPLWDALRQRMTRRGLEGAMMLGMLSDTHPTPEEVAFMNEVSGDLPWASHAHHNLLRNRPAAGNRILRNLADLSYTASVYDLSFQVNPDRGRSYGWRRPQLNAALPRKGIMNGACVKVRTLPEINITGGQRGLGRLGADIWPVVTDRRGRRVASVIDLYPENSARNLGLENWLLAPGPEGPKATARYENLREGIQECEARVFIEEALLDADKRSAINDDLARRSQQLLDERQRALWQSRGVNDQDLASQGEVSGKVPIEALWNAIAREEGLRSHDAVLTAVRERMNPERGQEWWLAYNWQGRSRRLFALAGEIADSLARE